MKWIGCFFLLVFVCAQIPLSSGALSKAALQETKKLMKNMCKRSSGVKQELINRLGNRDFVDDRKLKCYVHCCLGMMKTMKRDQITVADATRQIEMLLPQEMREPSLKQLNACKDVDGTDACDKAYNFIKCGYNIDSSNWLIPI